LHERTIAFKKILGGTVQGKLRDRYRNSHVGAFAGLQSRPVWESFGICPQW
jgi:hypothetical protein